MTNVPQPTLHDAIRAELAAARSAFEDRDTAKAARALEVAEDLLASTETKMRDALGLAEEAENRLGRAALAFAHIDGIAMELTSSAADRTAFNESMSEAIQSLRCIGGELGCVATLSTDAE